MGFSALMKTRISQTTEERWYAFGEFCVAVTERVPLKQTGPSLLFVHGRFSQPSFWESLTESLSSQHACYTVDLPGFGRSFSVTERGPSLMELVELTESLVDRYSSPGQPLIILGHDLGGALAQTCAISRGDRIRGMVLISSCSPAIEMECPGLNWPAAWPLRMRLNRWLKDSLVETRSERYEILAPWLESFSRNTLIRSLRAVHDSWPRFYERKYWRTALRKLNLPSLMVWGRRDMVHSSSYPLELMSMIPNASYCEHAEATHWPCIEDPDWLLSKLREYIFSLDLRKASSA